MTLNEREAYQVEEDLAYATGKARYLEGNQVEAGEVVRVTHISGTFQNAATTEYVVLGYWNGHAYVELYKAKPAVAGDLVHWKGNVWLREGQRVYAYFADVADGELMRLRAEGRRE